MRIKKFGLKEARKLLPKRKKSDNKSSAGRTLIIAGSEGMFGAAVLAADAASRVGSGYVNLFTSKSAFLTVNHPSFMVTDSAKNKLPLNRASSIAIGPGLGQSLKAERLIKELCAKRPVNVVIDADALNICAKNNWFPLPSTWVATPHEGELARILGISAKLIRKDRRAAVERAKKKIGCICVLKGDRTLIASDQLFEIQAGNASLAKAGTGDVLTGLIAGLLSQGLNPTDAACLGTFVHGWLADQWIRNGNDQLSLKPEDLIESLPKALRLLRG